MTSFAVEVVELSKAYNLGETGLRGLLGRGDALRRFWALRDVSFEIASMRLSALSAPMARARARF